MFFHLRALLTCEVVHIIKYIEIGAENYNMAWKSLSTCYNNKTVLIQTYLGNNKTYNK